MSLVEERMRSVEEGFSIEADGLHLLGEPTRTQLENIGREIKTLTNRANGALWALGDWTIECLARGISYAEMVVITGYSPTHLRGSNRVATNFPKDARVLSTPWAIHREVLRVRAGRRELLKLASEKEWNVVELAQHIDALEEGHRKRNAPPSDETIRKRKTQPLTQVRCPNIVKCEKCGHKNPCKNEFPIKGHKVKK